MAAESEIRMQQDGKGSLVIAFTGDVMLGRLVNEKITSTNYSYPWGNLLPLLRNADLNIINLETTLTTSERKVPKVFNYKADPDKVKSLIQARIDVATIANNHILDFSEEGLLETIAVLDKAGIKHVGAGENRQEAARPLILKIKDTSIGILGYTDNELGWEAGDNRPGTNYVRITDSFSPEVEREIKKLKEIADIIILTIHWGPNMRERPTKLFRKFAHSAIDSGVDIFHGHSAHIFQGVEIYKNGVIFYDTGDFIDDYYVSPSLRNDRSFLFVVELDKAGIKKIELIPVLISNMQVNIAAGEDYKEAIRKMKKLSSEFGTILTETEKGDRLLFHIR